MTPSAYRPLRIALWALAPALAASAQPARPLFQPFSDVSAPSHILERGGQEILTFETAQDYDRLQELCRESPDVRPEPGRLTTLYYRSDIDGSVQPYALWLPPGYDRHRTYPLVIQLHGTNFHEALSRLRLTYRGMGTPQWIPADLPVIYVQCFGGPETFYQGIGEEDVLRVLSEMERRFPIDPDRVYLMGHSMGGSGAYTVGMHHPDLFAGITAIDPAMWARRPPAEDLPPWMWPQIAIVFPPSLYRNAFDLDVFFKNAGHGIQRNSTAFSDGIDALGGHASTVVIPGVPHAFGNIYSFAHFVPELVRTVRVRHPATVKYYTDTLRFNRAYWVTIDRLDRPDSDATVTASCSGDAVRVTTSNIDALTLRLSDAPLPAGAAVALEIDGQVAATGVRPGVVHLARQTGQWRIGEWQAKGLVKRHGLQGPIDDAFDSRFLAVYGRGERALAVAELDAIRNPAGPLDIHGDFPMKPADDVTPGDIASSNLILFGTPQSNAVIRRIAGSLPPALMRPGSVFIYPNPENPARYVVIWSTRLLSLPESGFQPASWSRFGLFLGARWIMPLDRLPDYVRVEDGRIVAGGHFDDAWKMETDGGP